MNQKDVATLLNDKIQTVRGEQSSTILVGPIKLPVNLEGKRLFFSGTAGCLYGMRKIVRTY